jgi:hypothetical protein
MNKKITWSDLNNATFAELKKTYKLNDKQLEMGVRNHLDGASVQEKRDMYSKVWTPEEKR